MAIGPDDIRPSEKHERELREYARRTGRSEAEVIGAALDAYLTKLPRLADGETCYDIAKRIGFIGGSDNLPPDLSTNPDYFEGFGRD
jgi:hypothetical protein